MAIGRREHEVSDHKMVIRADARAIGAITALGAPMRSKPRMSDYRTGNRAGECISYYKDADGNIINAKVFTPSRTRKPNRRHNIVVTETRATVDRSLMARMGSNHEGDV